MNKRHAKPFVHCLILVSSCMFKNKLFIINKQTVYSFDVAGFLLDSCFDKLAVSQFHKRKLDRIYKTVKKAKVMKIKIYMLQNEEQLLYPPVYFVFSCFPLDSLRF